MTRKPLRIPARLAWVTLALSCGDVAPASHDAQPSVVDAAASAPDASVIADDAAEPICTTFSGVRCCYDEIGGPGMCPGYVCENDGGRLC